MPDQSDFEVIVATIHEALGDPTLEYSVFVTGAESLAGPRRVAWIPVTFGCEPSQYAADGSLFTDHVTVECHMMGETFADACFIRQQVCTAVRKVMRANSAAVDGHFPSEATSKQRIEWDGTAWIMQRFVWQMNVQTTEDLYPVRVRQIEVLDGTQITTADEGVLTPDETLVIEE